MPFDWEQGELKPVEEVTPSRLRPGRAPLLWVVVPLVLAYACAAAGAGAVPGWAVGGGLAGLAVAVVASWRGRRGRDGLPRYEACWGGGIVAAVFVLGWGWYGVCCPPPPDRSGLPPREAVLSVRVDEFFQAAGGGAATGLGTVTDAPAHLAEMRGVRIQFRLTSRSAPPPEADLGASVRLRGVLEAAPEAGGFGRYLRGRGVAYLLTRAKCEAVESPASGFRQACTRARERVAQALRAGVGPEDGARLAALMLGRTALLPKSEREDFKVAGATHLFAISGLHITGIAAGLLWAARRCRLRAWVAAPPVLAGLWLYVQMAGAPPSAMRAWVMAAAVALAWAAGRGVRLVHGLVLAALAVLVADPGVVRDPGFLLSYVAVAALLLHAAPLTAWWDRRWRPWRYIPPDALAWWKRAILRYKYALLASVSATLSAGVAGMPVVAALFGRVSWVGFAANPLLIPLTAPAVIAGFLSSALGAVGLGEWAAPCNFVAALCLRAVAWGAAVSARVPGASSVTPEWPVWAAGTGALAVLGVLLAYPPGADRSPWRLALLPLVVTVWFGCWLVA